MKKVFTVVLAALVLTCAAACGNITRYFGTEGVSERDSVTSEVSELDSEEFHTSVAESSEDESEEESEAESEEESKAESKTDSEAELDTSKMSNPFVFEKMAIDLPSDFNVDEATEEDSIKIVYSDNAADTGDNYTFTSAGSSDDISIYTQEAIEETYISMFEGFDGIDTYTTLTCDGYDALSISYDINYADVDMHQNQLYLFTDDDTYIITFTTVADDSADKKDEQFNESVKTIIVG